MKNSISPDVEKRLSSLRRAARELRQSSVAIRNQVLKNLSSELEIQRAQVLKANEADCQALESSVSAAFRDRLKLTEARLKEMQASLAEVIGLADPIGEIEDERSLNNGLRLKRVRSPLGVILMIFEARPNVIAEAFSLALKSGNALIMRGGSESARTSQVLYGLIEQALIKAGLPQAVFWGITDSDRTLVQTLMTQNRFIDVLVPRGGEALIEYVIRNATIPIIKNDRGLCHVYVHEDANSQMAIDIIYNAKTQRPGVCNAMETLLLHEAKKSLLPDIHTRLGKAKVEWFVCPESLKLLGGLPGVQPAGPQSFDTEYLELKLNCRIVRSLDEALDHIERHGSGHSEAIVTSSSQTAHFFQDAVDAAVVYWNASTRFTDGYQFGLGGELGISTQKLHVRGPVGLRELTSLRWVVDGTGQIRE